MASNESPEEIEELDSVHVDALLKAVEKAGEKPNTTVRVFERNDYYYLFKSDAEIGARFIYGATTALRTMGKKTPVNFCVMKYANFESFLRHILLVRYFRVEIYKFVPGKAGNAPSYNLEVRASPGNTASIEHILYGENDTGARDTNFLVGIKMNPSQEKSQVGLGLAAVDTCLNVVQVIDFSDGDSYANLEAFLVQIGPREVIIPKLESTQMKKISELVTRNKILVTERPIKEYSPLNEAELKRLFSAKSNPDLLKADHLSSGALSAVFSYLGHDTSLPAKLASPTSRSSPPLSGIAI